MPLKILPGFLLLLPIAEIAGFVLVGKAIGLWPTLALVILSFIAGMTLLRRQGIGILRHMLTEGRDGMMPGRELVRPAMFVIAALLLMVPGFITDIMALLIFVPAVRDLAWQYVSRRFAVVGSASSFKTSNRTNDSKIVDLDDEDYRREPNDNSPWSGKHLGK
ncbi:FxsA family protein [Rhizobium mesoamericanum]|uniref:FxsA cytoplasmic membrane protein n=1 Tax=Rhizobium mesoamericanum STM3625 TaxID=1211777 RepID=K0PVP4_9HYPH|nr:FxsA family protein [Rhizobium mesoamericanum]CCM77863.1 FxsA cytoplasmic membrane protein [Rhizobium mesoamericanum STM3625]